MKKILKIYFEAIFILIVFSISISCSSLVFANLNDSGEYGNYIDINNPTGSKAGSYGYFQNYDLFRIRLTLEDPQNSNDLALPKVNVFLKVADIPHEGFIVNRDVEGFFSTEVVLNAINHTFSKVITHSHKQHNYFGFYISYSVVNSDYDWDNLATETFLIDIQFIEAQESEDFDIRDGITTSGIFIFIDLILFFPTLIGIVVLKKIYKFSNKNR